MMIDINHYKSIFKFSLLLISVYLFATTWTEVDGSEKSYSRSIDNLKKLAYSELTIVKKILDGKKSLPIDSKIHGQIESYWQDFQRGNGHLNWSEWNVLENGRIIARNPISAYRLVRRYANYLPYLLSQVRTVFDVADDYYVIEYDNGSWPDKEDVDDAMDAILRIHHVNDLNITEFATGNITGILTGAQLDAVHCYEIGVYGQQYKYFSLAVEWLELALEKSLHENFMQNGFIHQALEKAIIVHDEELLQAPSWEPLFFSQPIQDTIGRGRQASYRQKRSHGLVLEYKGRRKNNYIEMNYWSLCQGENLQSEEEKSKLFCWYESKVNVAFTIGPMKMEFLARNPDVVQMYEMVGDYEITQFKHRIADKLTKAGVVEHEHQQPGGRTVVTAHRNAMSWWLTNEEIEEWTSLNRKIELATRLKVSNERSAEIIQLASYTFAGHYVPHVDALLHEHVYGADMGDRMATFMVYLDDVQLGGLTAFPMVGNAAIPVKGSAVFWYSLYRDLQVDNFTYHGACPVIMGEKWVANKWIRGFDQFLTHQCGLQPLERFQFPVNGKVIQQEILEKENALEWNINHDPQNPGAGEHFQNIDGHVNDFTYGSAAALKYLVKKEETIYSHLKTTLHENCNESSTKQHIKKYLKDYEATSGKLFQIDFLPYHSKTDGKEEKVSWNPLASYCMLRRFTNDLKILRLTTGQDDSCHDIQSFLTKEHGEGYWPTEQGYRDSMVAIYILQFMHDLKVKDIASGYIAGIDTGISLKGLYCYEIGKFGVETAYYSYGIEWLELAVNKLDTTTNNYELAVSELKRAIETHDFHYWNSQGWEPNFYASSFAEMGDKKDRIYRKDVQYEAFKYMQEPEFSEIQYWGICDKKPHQTLAQKSKLFCWYEREIHPYWKINPIKAEFHSLHPKIEIVQYHDILDDKTISKIIQSATPALIGSTTVYSFDNDNRALNSRLRLSANSWLSEAESLESYKTSRLVELITGLNVIGVPGDDLQVSSYTPGSHYTVHTDASGIDEEATGHRIATFMVYLSDVAVGGTTAFSQAGVQVYPSKGSAVFWYNMYTSGEANDLTWHGSCPIIFGEKWIANKWVSYEAQTIETCHTEKFKMREILVNGKSKYGRIK